jgi:hypothetical protein
MTIRTTWHWLIGWLYLAWDCLTDPSRSWTWPTVRELRAGWQQEREFQEWTR